jgi:DUF4097 and DUF4098 domain-containing protein YvlB
MHEFQTPEAIEARLTLLVANVTVDASDRRTTTVDVAPTDPTNPRDVDAVQLTEVDLEDGTLTVRTPRSGRWLASRPRGSVDVTVGLPTDSAVRAETATGTVRTTGTLGECRVGTAAADVAIERCATARIDKAAGTVTVDEITGDARVDSASGEIWIGRIGGGAKIDTASGEVRIGSVVGGLKVSGANGDIVVQRCDGSVKANTAFGSVRLLSVAEGTVKADSARGDIEIGIAEGTAAWLDLNTTFGTARSDLDSADAPADRERTVEVRANTAFGDITVRRAQPSGGAELVTTEA